LEETMTIAEHSTWVRKGKSYPAGAVRVIKVEGDRISFSPEGGGFVYGVPAERFLADFEPRAPEAPPPPWRAATFVIEGIDGQWPGWTQGFRWNGWAAPSFERSTIHDICSVADITWTEHDGDITLYPEDADPMELWPAFAEVEGVPRKLYSFDGWCWMEADQ
jgi:hypothetical protein